MPVFVSMLRGINVGKHKRMKMDQLRSSLEGLGYAQVKTYIQSGNVVFGVERRTPDEVSRQIERRIRADFGFPVDVITRTREEISSILTNKFFRDRSGAEGAKLHVIFLPTAAERAVLQDLKRMTTAPDESRCLGNEILLYLPNGFAQSSLRRSQAARRCLEQATMRNWNTVNALYGLARDLA